MVRRAQGGNGGWPSKNSGQVTSTDESWAAIESALQRGSRGLPRGSSLPKLLAEHRAVRNIQGLPTLSVEQILAWVDAHKAATGNWPNQKSGQVPGTDETWYRVDIALRAGHRGFPPGSSLPKLLAEHRGVRNHLDLSHLSIEQVLHWVDDYKLAAGGWPMAKSGQITGTDETWAGIDSALREGLRGLPRGSSLAKVLCKYRGMRNKKDLPPLTIEQILGWVDEYKATTGHWPNQKSGQIIGTDETWARVCSALFEGLHGVPRGVSLAKLLSTHRGARNVKDLPPLRVEQIMTWADAQKTAKGVWPTKNSGRVAGMEETWGGIDSALKVGYRGLPGGSSLAKLLKQRSVRSTT